MSETRYDIVIYGATSFVGKILVRYMASTFGASGELRWCIAGRSKAKLESIQNDIKRVSADGAVPDIVLADSTQSDQLADMCAQTRVMVSTVGPYALYGENLIAACVERGTDYCDITGEVHWVLKMISKYQVRAAETGARIVNCCGFDSIPSDLGVYFTQQEAKKALGQVCGEISMRIRFRGSFSGGTLASLVNAVKDLSEQPQLRKALASPYCLCPVGHPFKTRQQHLNGAAFDELSQQWITPFVMEGVNTRVVHRSNSLFDNGYGEGFKYDEAVTTGTGRKGRKRASKTNRGMKALTIGAALPPIRWLLNKFLLPKPGEGPSQEQQDKGNYTLTFYGNVRGKGSIRCTVSGDRDPGYGSTAKILAQTAACLATEIPKGEPAGGFWTPARIFNDKLIPKLQAHSGLSFEVEEVKHN